MAKRRWGPGIGRALTEACVGCARAAGYARPEPETVADNKRAAALYRSVGFAEYGRNPRGSRPRQGGRQENVLMLPETDEHSKEAEVFPPSPEKRRGKK